MGFPREKSYQWSSDDEGSKLTVAVCRNGCGGTCGMKSGLCVSKSF